MSLVAERLAASRGALEHFITVAQRVRPDAWLQPRAPGKWSPAQVAEHVAVTMDQMVAFMQGRPASVAVPRLLRPLARRAAFDPVLRAGRFPRPVRTPRGFEPSAAGVPQAEAAARLEAAHAALDHAAAGRADGDRFEHPVFGRIAYADYVRYNELHVRHHEGQLPSP